MGADYSGKRRRRRKIHQRRAIAGPVSHYGAENPAAGLIRDDLTATLG